MKQRKPKVQTRRKIGHLYQVFYGFPGSGVYGRGLNFKLARQDAVQQWKSFIA